MRRAASNAWSETLWAHGYWIRQRAIQCRPHTRLLPLFIILYKNKQAPRRARRRELRYQVQNTGCESKVSTCGDGKREEATVIPPKAGPAPASAHPPAATAAARTED